MVFVVCFVVLILGTGQSLSCSTEHGVVDSFEGIIKDVEVVGTHAYIVTKNRYSPGELGVIDISDPDDPFPIAGIQLSPSRYISSLHVVGNYAYATGFRNGILYVVDISNPENMEIKDSLSTGVNGYDYGKGVYVQGSYAYVLDYRSGLHVVDISDPENIFEVGLFSLCNGYSVLVRGDYAYVGHGGIMKILNISDPENPIEVETNLSGNVGGMYNMCLRWPYLYAANGNFTVLDVSDHVNPVLVKTYVTNGLTQDLAISENGLFVFLATNRNNEGYVEAVNINSLENPVSLCKFPAPYEQSVESFESNTFIGMLVFKSVEFDLPPVLAVDLDHNQGKTEGVIVGETELAINCGDGNSDCSEIMDSETQIELTAYPKVGYAFDHWVDNDLFQYEDNPLTVETVEDVSLEAVFERLRFPVGDGTLLDRTVSLQFGANWPFGECPVGTDKKHVGLDVKATKYEIVRATGDGKVKMVEYGGSSWRWWVTIEHTSYTTVYWHLENPSSFVEINDKVEKGQQIGIIADLGGNTHFHFGIRDTSYSNISNRGSLLQSVCGGDPAFPEYFIDPENLTYE